MAFCDYHACDHCGERKTFYDADIEGAGVDGVWRYAAIIDSEGNIHLPGYQVFALCTECEKTHEIVIQPRKKP